MVFNFAAGSQSVGSQRISFNLFNRTCVFPSELFLKERNVFVLSDVCQGTAHQRPFLPKRFVGLQRGARHKSQKSNEFCVVFTHISTSLRLTFVGSCRCVTDSDKMNQNNTQLNATCKGSGWCHQHVFVQNFFFFFCQRREQHFPEKIFECRWISAQIFANEK